MVSVSEWFAAAWAKVKAWFGVAEVEVEGEWTKLEGDVKNTKW